MMDLGSIFVTTPGERAVLDHFRGLYCAWIAALVLLRWRGDVRFVERHRGERTVPRFLSWAPLPHLRPVGVAMVGLGLCALLVVGAISDAAAGWALLAAAGGAVLYFAQVVDLPDVRRKANTVPLILLLVGAASLAAGTVADDVARMCRWTIQLVVAQMYFSSGLMKLRVSGRRWADGQTLRTWLVDYHLTHGGPTALWLAQRPRATRWVAGLTLVFELTFWLVIPFPVLGWIYLPLGLGFHLGTSFVLRIHYWRYVLPAYLAFVRW